MTRSKIEPSTKRRAKELNPATVWLIRRTRGLASEISRQGGFDCRLISAVLDGRKPPSARFRAALARAFKTMRAEVALEILRAEHSELFERLRR